VQLRLPDADNDTIRRAAERLMTIARARDVAFLLSESVELAAELGCDGVHLAKVADYAAARKHLGAKASIGVSCYDSRHLGMEAAEAGADYVSFGAFYESQSVKVTNTASIETLEWWSEIMTTPAVAIGGINAANCPPLVAAGTDFLAVIQAVWGHEGGAGAGVKALTQAIADAEAALTD
jgi:thiamine-phosphate pyrophosphorylase